MAKRRAAARRRNREMLRRVGAIFFVLVFVLGTATTIFVFQNAPAAAPPSNSTGANSNVPLATVPEAQITVALGGATPSGDTADSLAKAAQDAANQGKWDDAISFYNAALGLNPANATIQYELGKAYIQAKEYPSALSHLETALQLNPQAAFASDAQSLIDTYKDQATVGAATTPGASSSTTPESK